MDWIELNLPFGPLYDIDALGIPEQDSMHERGLVKPGVLLELASGERRLVGHINTYGSHCDHCPEVHPGDVVKRYCIVWKEK